jgi:hypothetical protein
VLQSHGDVKPIENRGLCNPDVGQDRPQTGTTVRECGHRSVGGAANDLKVSADQRRDVGVSLGDRSEHLSASTGGLDVADADLQVAFAFFAAADEGRVQADSDR